MGTQGARTSDLAEGGPHHFRRQLGFEGTQGREPRDEVAGVGHRLRGRPSPRGAAELGPGAASHSTPVVMQGKASEDKSLLLAWEEVRLLRTDAARASYLGIDRPDIAFSAKELCRRMSCPTKADLDALQQITQCIGVQRRNATRCPGVKLN